MPDRSGNMNLLLLFTVAAVAATGCERASGDNPATGTAHSIAARIAPPSGYERVPLPRNSFGAWLRGLPLRPGRPPVRLYDGREKHNQEAHHAILDLEVGDRDLQQCADAVIRLRAEYLFSIGCTADIHFTFTSGDTASWTTWRDGYRPAVRGNRVTWRQSAPADDGYASFRSYLDTVFMYAGSASLERELLPVTDPDRPEVGDVFIQGGFPGHAVLVVDVAQSQSGQRAFLLAQSYMPAQDIHILKSFGEMDPWYEARSAGALRTPTWRFRFRDLKRFPYTACETAAHPASDH